MLQIMFQASLRPWCKIPPSVKTTSTDMCLSACGCVILTCGWLTILFRYRNKLADEGKLIIDGEASFRYTI